MGARSIGTNLVSVTYYTPQWPFVDVMKSTKVNSSGFQWDLSSSSPTPSLDAQGYPVGLASGQVATTYALRGLSGRYPAGQYVVLFQGDGTVDVNFEGTRTSYSHNGSGTARFTAQVNPGSSGLILRITRSSASNHVRNIRVIMPGFEATHATQPFHPLFLQRIAPFSTLRFMDWGEINGSPVTNWSDRKRADHRSQHGRNGVAHEVMADLVNRTQKQMWVCVPHKATDDYVRQMATLLRDRVDPRLKIFVEYSNEVWNGAFSQYNDVNNVAKSKGLTFEQWFTQRSVQIFQIFEQVFGGRSRLVRVLGAHVANPGQTKRIVDALPSSSAADAVAIAPYIGGRLGNSSNWQTTRTWSVSQVLDATAADISRMRDLVRQNRSYAAARGLKLIAYEGGQHLAGVGSAANDSTLTSLFIAANRNSRMGQIYKDYLAMWAAEGGGTFVHFNDVYVPQKWGSWGSLEYQDQAPSTAPKYQALVETIQRWAQSP
ncbi:MAG: hypothetical protein KF878_10105 [Planctomycetes bacterium]|nr:hypothetical protein [Planctomycetota bacterium]